MLLNVLCIELIILYVPVIISDVDLGWKKAIETVLEVFFLNSAAACK